MKKSGQVYKRMFASYILVLFIPIVISVVLYFYTYNVVREQAEFYNGNLVGIVKSTCDREIEYYKSYLQQLTVDVTVKDLVAEKKFDSAYDAWNIFMLKEKLNSLYSSMRDNSVYCKGIFVYFISAERVVSENSTTDFNMYFQMNFKGNADEVREFLTQCDSESALSYKSGTEHYILLAEPVISLKGKKESAVVGIWIDAKALELQVQSMDWADGLDWMIIDSKNQIFRDADRIDTTSIDFNELFIDDNKLVDVNGESYIGDVMDSDRYGWKYVLFLDETYVSGPADKIRYWHLLSLLAILVTGYCVAQLLMKIHYNPLKRLMDILSKGHSEETEIRNEYFYLEHKVSNLLQSHTDIKKDMSRSKATLRNYELERLLLMSGIVKEDLQTAGEVFEKFNNGRNVVLLCRVQESFKRDNESEKDYMDSSLKRYVVSNVYAEGVGEHFKLEALEVEEKVAIIINVPEANNSYSETLQSVSETLRNFITEHFKFNICVLEGGCHEGLSDIHKSYLEACEAEEFVSYLDETYIRYNDIKDLSVRKYDYSFEMEERVINAIRSGSTERAISYIDSVLENNFNKNPKTSSEMITCLLYDIFGTLVKTSEELGIRNDKMLSLHYITAVSSIEDIKRFFKDMTDDICKEVTEKNGREQVEKLCQNVYQFISEQFTDPDINLSQTALHFHMTPAYLSAIFRKQTGESIVDVIRQMRVKYAKTLLEEGLSVQEVSQQVGFRECATFIRIFKESTGVTPGQMKKIDKSK